jgi:hypothetical protein
VSGLPYYRSRFPGIPDDFDRAARALADIGFVVAGAAPDPPVTLAGVGGIDADSRFGRDFAAVISEAAVGTSLEPPAASPTAMVGLPTSRCYVPSMGLMRSFKMCRVTAFHAPNTLDPAAMPWQARPAPLSVCQVDVSFTYIID